MNLNLNLDDKRIKKIVYQLENGKTVEYRFNNGELVETPIVYNPKECEEPNTTVNDDSLLYNISNQIDDAKKIIEMDKKGVLDEILKKKYGITDKDEKPLSDKEMIEAVKKSEFMDELNAARKRFKIDKEIVDGFPEKDDIYREKTKRSEDKCSEESLEAAQKIIKMDKEGRLDEILKRHGTKTIGDVIKRLESPFVDSELSDDSSACQRNMRTIEEKILSRLRMDGDDTTNDDELKELVENYRFYKNKKKEIDDKLWSTIPKVEPADCNGSHPVKK
jgi:hypothetical protein